jgi:hydrogenase expression/formation protein HypD
VKYVDEFRDRDRVLRCAEAIRGIATRPWKIMEVCGGQTHAIVRFGIDQLLPETITLLHGPGCPVCVTPLDILDKARAIAVRKEVVFCTFGDMLRVPGTDGDLARAKSEGADVRVVYSPMDAVRLAQENPSREVVFFAVGFETTAPANAMAVHRAAALGLRNFSLLVSHMLVPPALTAILDSPSRQVDGFLAAGHVCTIMGVEEYREIAERYRVPIVVTGFEPLDILQGIRMCVAALEAERSDVAIAYARAVTPSGNEPAQRMIREIFEVAPRTWRGIGPIPRSGLALRPPYRGFDAERRFQVEEIRATEPSECQSGLVLQGIRKPEECPAFATRCTPDTPLGATMVSSEGACAAYYRYRRSA